jgi:hypothetical protein
MDPLERCLAFVNHGFRETYMVLNNRLRQRVRHVPITPGTSARRSAARRRNGHGANVVQAALFHCRIEVLEDRLLLTVSAPVSATVNAGSTLVFSRNAGDAIIVRDPRATLRSDETVALSVSHGKLTLGSNSVSVIGGMNDSPSIRLRGTLLELDAALNGLTYAPASGYGKDLLTIALNGGGKFVGAGSASVAITIDGPPVLTGPSWANLDYNFDVTFSNILLTDPVAENAGSQDFMTLSASEGKLLLGQHAIVSIVTGANRTGYIEVEGTVDNLNAALDGLVYSGNGKYDSLQISVANELDNKQGSFSVFLTPGYTPAQIRAAYGFNDIEFFDDQQGQFTFPPGDGRGQTIAIVAIGNDPNIEQDANVFDAQYSLPPLTASTFTIYEAPGTTDDPTYPQGTGTAFETSLDVEWAHAMAPGANILLVEEGSQSDEKSAVSDFDIANGASYAANQPGVSVVSISYGGYEYSFENGLDALYTGANPADLSQYHPVGFVASSGDSPTPTEAPGVRPPSQYATIEYPATSPEVLAVGGTYFTNSLPQNGKHQIEDAWSYSGGGTSVYEDELVYQDGALVSTGPRTSPDVAYNAENYSVYDSYSDVGWDVGQGTSFGAPQWAALIAIADQGRSYLGLPPLDNLPSRIAMLPSSDFHDITNGENKFDGIKATKGYDEVTGYGTPKANLVVFDLMLDSPFPPIEPPYEPLPVIGGSASVQSATTAAAQSEFGQGSSASLTQAGASGQAAGFSGLSPSLLGPFLAQAVAESAALPLVVSGASADFANPSATIASAQPIALENSSGLGSTSRALNGQVAGSTLGAALVSFSFSDLHGRVPMPDAGLAEGVDQLSENTAVHEDTDQLTGCPEDADRSEGAALVVQATDACFKASSWIVDSGSPRLQTPTGVGRQKGKFPAFAVTIGILSACVVRGRSRLAKRTSPDETKS